MILNSNDRFVEYHTPLGNDVKLRIGVNLNSIKCLARIKRHVTSCEASICSYIEIFLS